MTDPNPSKTDADPFAQDAAGRTALFHAAERGDLEGVRRMVFRLAGTGVSCQRLRLIEIRDRTGLTAADVAQQNGHRAIADLLWGEQQRIELFE